MMGKKFELTPIKINKLHKYLKRYLCQDNKDIYVKITSLVIREIKNIITHLLEMSKVPKTDHMNCW
jgi:hypothetical protein